MEFDSKNAAYREIERGTRKAQYAPCVHLSVEYYEFEGHYYIRCAEDSFEHPDDSLALMSGVVRCPRDCRFFKDRNAAREEQEAEERRRREEHEREAKLVEERRQEERKREDEEKQAQEERAHQQAEEDGRRERQKKIKNVFLWIPRTFWKAFLELPAKTQIAIILAVAFALLLVLAPAYVTPLIELMNALKGLIHGGS